MGASNTTSINNPQFSAGVQFTARSGPQNININGQYGGNGSSAYLFGTNIGTATVQGEVNLAYAGNPSDGYQYTVSASVPFSLNLLSFIDVAGNPGGFGHLNCLSVVNNGTSAVTIGGGTNAFCSALSVPADANGGSVAFNSPAGYAITTSNANLQLSVVSGSSMGTIGILGNSN